MNDNPQRSLPEVLETVDTASWCKPVGANARGAAVAALEDGKVLFFSRLSFDLRETETHFVSPAFADERAKNISFDPFRGEMKHIRAGEDEILAIALTMRRRHDDARMCCLSMVACDDLPIKAIEQIFYLPVAAMAEPAKSPLRILERIAGQHLA